jgi:RES domain-containing protein
VNLDVEEAPSDLVLVPVDLPEEVGVEVVARGQLPLGWRKTPGPEALARLGSDWVRSRRSLALSVPSAVVPQERNYLLNPAHPDFARVVVGRREPFSFDPRMWR